MSIISTGAGHGGLKTGGNWRDSGAVGSGYQEADVARTINAKIIAKTGVLDTTDNAGTSQNDNLAKIAAKINAGPDGWALSNHLNSYNGKASGIEVLYGSPSSADMANKVSAAIAGVLELPNRGAKDGSWLSIARNSYPGKKVLLIEWGFIDNPNDMKKLMANMDKSIDAALACFGYDFSEQKVSSMSPDIKWNGGNNMWAFYQANSKSPMRWWNGEHAYALGHPDEVKAINDIYRANTGHDVPVMTNWNDKAPYYNRLANVLKRKPDF